MFMLGINVKYIYSWDIYRNPGNVIKVFTEGSLIFEFQVSYSNNLLIMDVILSYPMLQK